MKFLSRFIENAGKFFEKGQPLEKLYPLYEAFDSFLFGSNQTTKQAPHIRDSIDLKRIMTTVLIALIPCTFMALWNTGYQANQLIAELGTGVPGGWRGSIMTAVGCDPHSVLSNLTYGALYFLPIYVVTMVVGSFWEGVFNLVRGHEFSEAFLVTGLLFSLSLPPDIPLWQVAVGISFGLVFAKEVFGGVGRNFMNPALASRAFLYFAYPAQMTGDTVWNAVDGVSSATPLGQIAAAAPGQPLDTLSFSWVQSFLGTIPGSMGETSTLACLFGAAVLLVTRIAPWRVIAAGLLGAILCSCFFYFSTNDANPLWAIPPHHHLVYGGFAFGLVFMATDPVSAAHTAMGQWIYGILVGVLAIMIRVANPAYPEGIMLAILLGNIFAPLFDFFVIQANIKRRILRNG
ncbi:NADH:ubiquinone reductase (Na(+)-transporting) subunit B [Desulforhopalus singaporensis]|uniref:Na(+)-translocating NADH-quinone reductase subunit B n=1 Tax=Desulforhopalus singaporensis TaxID=91360 RepID=A0A1H0SYR1_9BACT|nr:NADH:ubiquinone reductase (Na(+)-transporting) subunit B [Desulforhopalus singaporensis]SDP46710.1 Na+-transporting NADH:ubiquinone oxidoreductase subunit B [Desulforhopalus singaporensis]